jgi:hypothetical protein
MAGILLSLSICPKEHAKRSPEGEGKAGRATSRTLPDRRFVGSTDHRGAGIKDRRVTPSDLAATVFRHLDIPLDAQWINPQGRPVPIITEGGQPIAELG